MFETRAVIALRGQRQATRGNAPSVGARKRPEILTTEDTETTEGEVTTKLTNLTNQEAIRN